MTETVKCRKIHEIHIPDKRLGRHVEHDERSRAFGIVRPRGILQPVRHKRHGIVLDQGNLGSCTGNAAAGLINTDPTYRKKSRTLKEDQAVELYVQATRLDDISGAYPPEDTGSSGLGVAKAAKQLKYIKEYRHAFGIDDALYALQTTSVITGVDWYEGFDQPDEHGVVKVDGLVRGGHEFHVIGYDPSTRLVECVNSWGKDWGKKGHFFFTTDTWHYLLENEGDVTVLAR